MWQPLPRHGIEVGRIGRYENDQIGDNPNDLLEHRVVRHPAGGQELLKVDVQPPLHLASVLQIRVRVVLHPFAREDILVVFCGGGHHDGMFTISATVALLQMQVTARSHMP